MDVTLTPKQRRISTAISECKEIDADSLDELVETLRDGGFSWRAISHFVFDHTMIEVSDTTLIDWYGGDPE